MKSSIPGFGGYQRRVQYDAYMRSADWFARREQWAAVERERREGRPIVCAACDEEWSLRDDLHHLDYSNLQHERHEDLVPVHRACHDDIHHLLDTFGFRRNLPARLANLAALDRVRAAKGI